MLTTQQVTALTAQARRANQYPAYDAENNLLPDWQMGTSGTPYYLGPELGTRGIGVYGQSPAALANTGYLKPGTLGLITGPSMVFTVLNTPGVWTGKDSIESLEDYLDNPILQNLVQIQLMQGAYQGLLDVGILNGNEVASYQATFLQPATQYGVDAVVDWVNGTSGPELTVDLFVTARQGQYAIAFINQYQDLLEQGIDLPGFTNTVVRDEIDQTVTDIIGSAKIPVIEFADVTAEDLLTGARVPAETDEEGTFRFAPGKPKA